MDSKQIKDQLILLYGSQTGTAEDLATRLAKETSTNYGLSTLVCDIEEYDMEELFNWPRDDPTKNYLLGFFMATYGEGEPTDNATDFYSWIMNGSGLGEDSGDQEDEYTDSKPMSQLPFFVFGLGNSTYAHFNAIGQRLDARIRKLGGKTLYPLGLGDDDKRYDLLQKNSTFKKYGR